MFKHITLALAAILAVAAAAKADEVAPLSALAKMPIKEVTVFKDGHAFVLHEGKMPVDESGDVLMDYLPTPVLGTFWASTTQKDVKLQAVVASQRLVAVEQTALNLRDLLETNVGAEVVIRENPSGAKDDTGMKYDATILGVPERSSDELQKTAVPGAGPFLPVKGELILLKTPDGTKAVNINRIAEVTFKGKVKPTTAKVEFRNLLRLKLAGAPKGQPVDAGLMYVQKGLRWIPSYKVTIDGKGVASVKLEATIINELADLEDATANLVIGVPTFAMENNVDPIALQQTLANLSQHFQRDVRTANYLSNGGNAMMTQSQYAGPTAGDAPARPMDLGPEVGGSSKAEDLFVYTVSHITLKRGQRMVVPVAEFELKYRDVYVLDVPITPPQEMWRNIDTNRQAELARMLSAPKAMHKLRLTNATKSPLTTAPALIILDNKPLAQGMMYYTPAGGETDLALTTAVDIGVKKTDKEVKRVPNAASWEGGTVAKAELEGTLKLINHKDRAVDVEVTRYIIGNADTADNDGKVEMVNVLEDNAAWSTDRPAWWGWYSWPNWWGRFNGMGRITWKFKLEPGKDIELKYTWNYFWR